MRFTFVTGVSKFTKVSLFSDLNNLIDITLDPAYSSICGYTEGDLETVCSRRRWPAWTGSACASGTTAIAGWAREKGL